ncbi:MAG: ABC transporter ATP-binding protein [Treponemataceae bacterium]|nr:ABC transporter ATP-binding protein [Treponemataceae bacterium]
MNSNILNCDSVCISYDGIEVVHDLSFSLPEGEILALVGESGCGKSTLLKAVMGLLPSNGKVTAGKITFMDKNLLSLNERQFNQMRGSEIAMIFQDAGESLCPVHTIGYQVYETMKSHGKITKLQARERGYDLFQKLNLSDFERIWKSYPFELSGGMNQRVGIAISMLLNPPLLLADEPSSSLDVSSQKQLAEEMLLLRELYGTSILLVTHDLAFVKAVADSILILKNGRCMEYGRAKDVLSNPCNEYTKELLASVPRLCRKG